MGLEISPRPSSSVLTPILRLMASRGPCLESDADEIHLHAAQYPGSMPRYAGAYAVGVSRQVSAQSGERDHPLVRKVILNVVL